MSKYNINIHYKHGIIACANVFSNILLNHGQSATIWCSAKVFIAHRNDECYCVVNIYLHEINQFSKPAQQDSGAPILYLSMALGGTDKDIRAPGSGCLFTLEKPGVCWLAVWWLKVWQHMTAGYFYISTTSSGESGQVSSREERRDMRALVCLATAQCAVSQCCYCWTDKLTSVPWKLQRRVKYSSNVALAHHSPRLTLQLIDFS